MPCPPRRRVNLGVLTAITVAVVVALIVAGCGDDASGGAATDAAASSDSSGADGGWHGAILTEPEPRPDFTLTDTSGSPYDFREETGGELTLLFLGYTNCPDICPLQMATLATALETEGMPEATVVFVTTDPERDTPEKVRTWLDAFDTDFVGLTGTPEEIREVEEIVGLGASFLTDVEGAPLEEAPEDGPYEVAHPSQVVAYTADDVAYTVYLSGVQRADWEADLPRLAAGEVPEPS